MNQPPYNFPPNMWPPEPRPPVSGHSQPQAPVGNTGVVYGTQAKQEWLPGQTDVRELCDALKCPALWRFSCFGRVLVTVDYGTRANRSFSVLAPVVLTIPGQFSARAAPIDANGTVAEVTLTQATAGTRSIARALVDAGAGAVPFSEDAVDFFALVASTLTVAGIAVVVPALSFVPLVAGAVLTTGAGFQEFET